MKCLGILSCVKVNYGEISIFQRLYKLKGLITWCEVSMDNQAPPQFTDSMMLHKGSSASMTVPTSPDSQRALRKGRDYSII